MEIRKLLVSRYHEQHRNIFLSMKKAVYKGLVYASNKNLSVKDNSGQRNQS